jgi:nucleotide-binding universal stress UspA family protein
MPTTSSAPPVNGSQPPSGRPPRIVAAYDFTPQATAALRRAVAVAEAHGAELHVVCVREPGALVPALHAEMPAAALGRLRDAAVAEIGAAPHLAKVVTHLLVGTPATEIAWLAAHLDADLVVVGTHGRTGVSRFVLGSVAEKLTRIAGCPVLVERAKQHDPKVMVPEIEPLCPKCAEHRERSAGAELWCAEHASHHVQTHVYSGERHSHPMSFRSWGFSA